MGLNLEEQKAVDRFRKDVAEPSMTKLVILDFWAEWCGPCKALAPMLEKVCAEYADKGVVLAKVNVDEEQFIAAQFQVRSIPTVYAMFQGQPVADLTNARSESQLRQVLDQLLAKLPVDGGDAWIVRVQHKPFVTWIWGGCLIMALGGLIALSDRRYRLASPREPALGSERGAVAG